MLFGLQYASTRHMLRVIDASRPLLCLVTVVLSMAFAVLLYMHIPTFWKRNRTSSEPQPMFVLPTMIILVHVGAVVIGLVSFSWAVGAHEHPCAAFFTAIAYGSFFFAPVVGWVVLKVADGPSIFDMMRQVPGVWWAFQNVAEKHVGDLVCEDEEAGEGPSEKERIDSVSSVESIRFEEVSETPANDESPAYYDAEANLRDRSSPAHMVFSSAWSRVAIAAAALQASALQPERLFMLHAAALGNGVVVLCTIALAAPDGSTLLPHNARAVGVAAVVAAVLYQASVFVPGTFARPPMMALLFLLCFTHDIATVVGALSCVGTCEGSGCVSMGAYGYAYNVSATSLAALLSVTWIVPFATIALYLGSVAFVVSLASPVLFQIAVGILMSLLCLEVAPLLAVLAFFPATVLCVPCLCLVAAVVLGFGPRDPGVTAAHTLLHVFCDKVNAAFMQAAALVEPGSTAELVLLSPLCESSILCRGPRAAEIHVLRHCAAQHIDKLCFRVVETPGSRQSSPTSAAPDMPAPTATGTADDEPRREIVDEDLAQQFAVSMAEAAAVLTPHPTPAALPTNVQNSPMAYLTEHLVAAEVAASAERKTPLAQFIEGAELGSPCAGDSAAPTIAPAARPPADAANASSSYCHIDLATETFDHALEGGWAWLLRFAWRRRAFASVSGLEELGELVAMWRDTGLFARAKAVAVWTTIAVLLLSRPVLFFAPLLEPAFNTNVPTMAYVCIAVRVVCWVGLALIAPAAYRTMCRAAAFSVVNGPEEARPDFSRQFDAAARCIAAAYTPHPMTVLRGAVPHHVVSHLVISDAVAPYLTPKQLRGAPVT